MRRSRPPLGPRHRRWPVQGSAGLRRGRWPRPGPARRWAGHCDPGRRARRARRSRSPTRSCPRRSSGRSPGCPARRGRASSTWSSDSRSSVVRHSSSSVPKPHSATSSGRPGSSSARRRSTRPSPRATGRSPWDRPGRRPGRARRRRRRPIWAEVVGEADQVERAGQVVDLDRRPDRAPPARRRAAPGSSTTWSRRCAGPGPARPCSSWGLVLRVAGYDRRRGCGSWPPAGRRCAAAARPRGWPGGSASRASANAAGAATPGG